MISTAWPRFSSSRLRPYTTSPSPPACATGAHSDDTMTMYMTLPDAGGENRHKRRVKSLPHRTIARERLGLRLADRDGADVLVREHLGHLCDARLRLHGDDRRRHQFAGGDRVDWPLAGLRVLDGSFGQSCLREHPLLHVEAKHCAKHCANQAPVSLIEINAAGGTRPVSAS